MAGLLSDILGFIDRAKQSAKANVGLLVNDPREYFMSMEDQARENNRLGALAIQAERNAARGLPVTPEQAAAKQYVDQKTADIAMGFAGTTKVGKTPFELAHETAQKNATTMLGLPPNNTAMDRAMAMGFDANLLHGTDKNISKFNKEQPISKDFGWYGDEGVYLTPDPSSASGYANWRNLQSGNKDLYGQNVMPLMVRRGNVFDYGDAPPLLNREEAKKFSDTIKRLGYDTVEVPNKYADPAYARNYETVVVDPSRIRSKFAAFDPAKINESDLLAAGIPLGLIANTEIDIPKKKKKGK